MLEGETPLRTKTEGETLPELEQSPEQLSVEQTPVKGEAPVIKLEGETLPGTKMEKDNRPNTKEVEMAKTTTSSSSLVSINVVYSNPASSNPAPSNSLVFNSLPAARPPAAA